MEFPEKEEIAVVSTVHVSCADMEILGRWASQVNAANCSAPLICQFNGNEDYGVMVNVFDCGDETFDEAVQMMLEHVTQECVDILASASAQGFHWVRFDSDGPEISGLNKFDWN